MKDMNSTLDYQKSIESITLSATVDGAGVDIGAYEGAELIADIGIFGGTTPTGTLEIQESDTLGSGYTAVATADLVGGPQLVQLTATNDQRRVRRSYIGKKQFVRWALTAIAGTSPVLPLSAGVVRGFARRTPLADQL